MQQVVQVGQGPELDVDGIVPVLQVKPVEKILVHSRQMPVAKELGDVHQFIVQTRHIHADLAEITADLPADPAGTRQIAIGQLEHPIQDAVIGGELCKLNVGQFHDVDDLLQTALLAHHKGGIPVRHDQIGLVIGEVLLRGFGRLLGRQAGCVALLRQQGSDGPTVLSEPVLSPARGGGLGRRQLVDTEDRVILTRPDGRHRSDQARLELPTDLLGDLNHLGLNAFAGETEAVVADKLLDR